jgi:hypothetical protein
MDLVLLTGGPETTRLCHARIKDALAAGTITRARLLQAATRVIALKLHLALAPSLR